MIVTWWYVWCIVWASGNQEEVQACLVTLFYLLYHATVYIKLIPITNTKQPLQESSGSFVNNLWESVMKMVLLLSVYTYQCEVWNIGVHKCWKYCCSAEWCVIYFKLYEVKLREQAIAWVWCHVCPLLVSWVHMFRWEADWGCDVMPGLVALRRGWVRVPGLPSTGIRLPGSVGRGQTQSFQTCYKINNSII